MRVIKHNARTGCDMVVVNDWAEVQVYNFVLSVNRACPNISEWYLAHLSDQTDIGYIYHHNLSSSSGWL